MLINADARVSAFSMQRESDFVAIEFLFKKGTP